MHSIIRNKVNELSEICKIFNVKRLYVFGSINTDTFDEQKSDIDLIVELDQRDSVYGFFSLYFDYPLEQTLKKKERDLCLRQNHYNRPG